MRKTAVQAAGVGIGASGRQMALQPTAMAAARGSAGLEKGQWYRLTSWAKGGQALMP